MDRAGCFGSVFVTLGKWAGHAGTGRGYSDAVVVPMVTDGERPYNGCGGMYRAPSPPTH